MNRNKVNQGSIPGRCRIFFLLHHIQNISRANPNTYSIGNGDFFQR